MRLFLSFSIIFSAIALPVCAELTQQDLDKIRLIIHEENEPIKTEIASVKAEIASVKIDVAWIRGRIDGVEKQLSLSTNFVYGLIALIVAAVGIPQVLMVWRGRRDREQERKIEELTREIEALKQQRIVSP